MARRWDGKVPLSHGHMVFSLPPNKVALPQNLKWVDARPFDATLRYQGYHRGRTSVAITMRDERNYGYFMFIKDFDAALQRVPMNDNCITGRWEYVKYGYNYGVRLV